MGVFTAPGVFGHAACAGLGVILTKSEKSNICEGVLGTPNPDMVPPGVVIMEEGSAMLRGGGVDGG
jgi:hypothetical protein